jgi:hypothetical protein
MPMRAHSTVFRARAGLRVLRCLRVDRFEGYVSRMSLAARPVCASWGVSGCPYAVPHTIVRMLNQDVGNSRPTGERELVPITMAYGALQLHQRDRYVPCPQTRDRFHPRSCSMLHTTHLAVVSLESSN